jgi:hypothetical protein
MSEQSLETVVRLAVTQCVGEHWEKHHRALTLAALGNQMKSKGFDLKTFLKGQKLASFIHTELAAELYVAADPEDAGTLGVLPRSQQNNKDAFRGVIKTYGSPPIPRYQQAIWQAFTRPIREGTTRIVTLSPTFNFFDANEESRKGLTAADTYVIAVDDIAQRQPLEDNGHFARRVSEKIVSWHEKHALPTAGPHLQRNQELGKGGTAGLTATTLDRLLDALSKEQLARVSLPLDVIDSLRKG